MKKYSSRVIAIACAAAMALGFSGCVIAEGTPFSIDTDEMLSFLTDGWDGIYEEKERAEYVAPDPTVSTHTITANHVATKTHEIVHNYTVSKTHEIVVNHPATHTHTVTENHKVTTVNNVVTDNHRVTTVNNVVSTESAGTDTVAASTDY